MPPEEDRNSSEGLEQLGVQNNLSHATQMMLDSIEGEGADKSGAFLTIGLAEPDINKIREQMGCRFHYGLGTITLQISALKTIKGDVQSTVSSSGA